MKHTHLSFDEQLSRKGGRREGVRRARHTASASVRAQGRTGHCLPQGSGGREKSGGRGGVSNARRATPRRAPRAARRRVTPRAPLHWFGHAASAPAASADARRTRSIAACVRRAGKKRSERERGRVGQAGRAWGVSRATNLKTRRCRNSTATLTTPTRPRKPAPSASTRRAPTPPLFPPFRAAHAHHARRRRRRFRALCRGRARRVPCVARRSGRRRARPAPRLPTLTTPRIRTPSRPFSSSANACSGQGDCGTKDQCICYGASARAPS